MMGLCIILYFPSNFVFNWKSGSEGREEWGCCLAVGQFCEQVLFFVVSWLFQ